MRSKVAIGIAALGGASIALSTLPLDLVPGVIVGLALLAYALGEARSLRAAVLIGIVWGTVAGVIGLRFVVVAVQRFTGTNAVLAWTHWTGWMLSRVVTLGDHIDGIVATCARLVSGNSSGR